MPLDHVASAGSLKEEGSRITKAFFFNTRRGEFSKKHTEQRESVLFGCRTGSPARSPLLFVLGPSLLLGALEQARVP